MSTDDWDLISIPMTARQSAVQLGPKALKTHGPGQCAGDRCTIHNPSNHHMATWPQNWRVDQRIMERVCPHGVGHIDPDDVFYDDSCGPCDGCCVPPTPDGV